MTNDPLVTERYEILQSQSDLERKVQILARLTEISTALNSTVRLKPLLDAIMDATLEITGSQAASVLLWDSATRELRFAATSAGPGSTDLVGKPVPLEGSIAGTVLRERRVVVVDQVAADPRHYSKLDQENAFQTRSILAVPLTSKRQTIGVLEAVNKHELPWTEDDCYYVSILASQAAVAIEGAQLVMQLQKANDDLAQLDKLKNDFIAITSHELRTPLGVILGYASFLQDTKDGEVSEHAAKVVGSALQLRRIIEDLTNLRHLETSESDLFREPLALADLLRDVALDVKSLAEAKRHLMHFDDPPAATLIADRIRLGMALANIVHNAIRFTPDGGEIRVAAELHGQYAIIQISDNGIGFTPDQAERLFEKFYQVEDHMTRKHGGLGIGLSITQALVEAHGGRVVAKSPGLDRGATFTIVLPLANGAG